MLTKKGFTFLLLLAFCSGCYNYTKGKSNVCEMHQVKMFKKTLPVKYGLIKDSGYLNDCPNGRGFIAGGCVLRPVKWGVAYQCEICTENCSKHTN